MRTEFEINQLLSKINNKLKTASKTHNLLGQSVMDINKSEWASIEKCKIDLITYIETGKEPDGGHNSIRLWLIGDDVFSPIYEMIK
jgi:hypothetical protein